MESFIWIKQVYSKSPRLWAHWRQYSLVNVTWKTWLSQDTEPLEPHSDIHYLVRIFYNYKKYHITGTHLSELAKSLAPRPSTKFSRWATRITPCPTVYQKWSLKWNIITSFLAILTTCDHRTNEFFLSRLFVVRKCNRTKVVGLCLTPESSATPVFHAKYCTRKAEINMTWRL